MDRWPLSYSTIDHIQIDMSGIKYVIGPISICNFFLNCVTSSINTEWLINNLYSALYFCHSLKFLNWFFELTITKIVQKQRWLVKDGNVNFGKKLKPVVPCKM